MHLFTLVTDTLTEGCLSHYQNKQMQQENSQTPNPAKVKSEHSKQ